MTTSRARHGWAYAVAGCAVIVVLALWIAANTVAHAQLADTKVPAGAIELLFKAMRATVDSWQRAGQQQARGIFGVLASINILWVGIEVLTSGGMDAKGGVLRLAREVFVLSFFYALIELGPDLAREVLKFFENAGNTASAGVQKPAQEVLDAVVKTCVALMREEGTIVPGLKSIWLALCAVGIIVLVGIITAVMLVVEFVTYVAIGVGAILLGGGGSIWTRFLVTNYLKFAGGAAVALYFLRFTQNFVLSNLHNWAIEALPEDSKSGLLAALAGTTSKTTVGPEMLFTMLCNVTIEALLVVVAPTLAVALFAGGLSSVAEYAGGRAAMGMVKSGVGQGARAVAAGASVAAGSAKAAVAGAFGGSGSGASLLSRAGGPKPEESGQMGAAAISSGRSGERMYLGPKGGDAASGGAGGGRAQDGETGGASASAQGVEADRGSAEAGALPAFSGGAAGGEQGAATSGAHASTGRGVLAERAPGSPSAAAERSGGRLGGGGEGGVKSAAGRSSGWPEEAGKSGSSTSALVHAPSSWSGSASGGGSASASRISGVSSSSGRGGSGTGRDGGSGRDGAAGGAGPTASQGGSAPASPAPAGSPPPHSAPSTPAAGGSKTAWSASATKGVRGGGAASSRDHGGVGGALSSPASPSAASAGGSPSQSTGGGTHVTSGPESPTPSSPAPVVATRAPIKPATPLPKRADAGGSARGEGGGRRG